MRKKAILVFVLSLSLFFVNEFATRKVSSQVSLGSGRILAPILGQPLQAHVPFDISWQLDRPDEVASLDIFLSTDGGRLFDSKIAGSLNSQQQHLKWSAPHVNVTATAHLLLLLRDKNGSIARITSEQFAILPPPVKPVLPSINTISSKRSRSTSGGIQPAFAGPGPCLPSGGGVGEITTFGNPCTGSYFGEPSLASDSTVPNHFVTATGSVAINSTNVTPYTDDDTLVSLPFGQYISRGDLTTEIASNGRVFVGALASTRTDANPNKLLIFRSIDGGLNFQAPVEIPKLPQQVVNPSTGEVDTPVDKGVIATHPDDPNTLIVTFNQLNTTFDAVIATYVAVCNQALSANLGDPNVWEVYRPTGPNGAYYLNVNLSTHPLIDPVSTGSPYYWLFIVQLNQSVSLGAGYVIHKYQVNRGSLFIGNAVEAPKSDRVVNAPLWDKNNNGCTAIEKDLRVVLGTQCARNNTNLGKAAIGYCTTGAHKMYIPTLADTRGIYPNGNTSDLFMTVWTYTGSIATVHSRVETSTWIPNDFYAAPDQHKYVPCAVTDNRGRAWVTCFAITPDIFCFDPEQPCDVTYDYQRAELAIIALNPDTGAATGRAYLAGKIPSSTSFIFLGDYIFTQASYDPNYGTLVVMPSYTDWTDYCGARYFAMLKTR